MSYDSAKYIYPDSKNGQVFSGGLVTNTPNTHLDPIFMPYGRNFRLDGQSVVKRPWFETFATVSGTDYPRGISTYLRSDATLNRVVVRQNVDATHKLVSITEAWVKTNILTNSSISSDDRMSFVNIGDDLYCMNWTDFGKLNGTTYTAISTARSITWTTISFNSTTPPRTIQDSAGWFIAAGFAPWMVITITGSASNNKTVTILSVTATDIQLISWDTLTDESPWASVTITTASVSPSFGVYFAGCHWVGWFTTAGFANQVWKSPTNNVGSFTGSGSDIFTFPETVTGINVAGQAIFVFTTNTIHTCTLGDQVETAGVITFSFKPIQATEGTTSNASIVSVGSNLYYLTSSNKVNMIARGNNIYGFEVIEMSDRKYKGINNLMDLYATDQSGSFAQYYPEQSIIKWFLKNQDSTFNDVCVIYDVEKDMFLLDTNKYFYDATYLNGQVYAISTITPTVFKDEYGIDDQDSWVDFEVWTKAFDEGEYTMRKAYWEARTDISMSELAVVTQQIFVNSEVDEEGNFQGQMVDELTVDDTSLDLGLGGIGTQPIGTFPVGLEGYNPFDMYPLTLLRTKGNLNVRAQSIQFRFTCNTIGSRVQLKRLGYKMEMLPSITTSLTRAAATILTTESSDLLMTEDGDFLII